MHGRKVPKYFDQPIGPEKDGRGRMSFSAPRTSPGRLLRGRFYRKQAEKRAANFAVQAALQPRAKAPPASFGPTPLKYGIFFVEAVRIESVLGGPCFS